MASPLHPESVARTAYADGVLHREQAAIFALTRSEVRAQVAASRWTSWGDHVVIQHNGPLTRRQLIWLALLDAGWPSAIVAHTSLELAGFQSFAAERQQIHIVIPRGARTTPYAWLRVHESRRICPDQHVSVAGVPGTPLAQSAIDAAAWQPYPRFAWALVAAVVQQRLATAVELDDALRTVGRVRHKAVLRAAVADLRAGGTTTGEADVMRMCRRFGLQVPQRQVRRRGQDGRLRYLDAEWVTIDGERVVLEVDGAHHLEVAHWQNDLERERGIVVSGARVLRTSNMEMRLSPQTVATDLIAAGVPRATPSPSCQIPGSL